MPWVTVTNNGALKLLNAFPRRALSLEILKQTTDCSNSELMWVQYWLKSEKMDSVLVYLALWSSNISYSDDIDKYVFGFELANSNRLLDSLMTPGQPELLTLFSSKKVRKKSNYCQWICTGQKHLDSKDDTFF